MSLVEAAASMETVAQAFEYVRMPGDIDDPYSEAGSLAATLGIQADTPLDEVGFIPVAEFESSLSQWFVGNGDDAYPAPPLLKGKAAKMGKLARIKANNDASTQSAPSSTQDIGATAAAITAALAPILKKKRREGGEGRVQRRRSQDEVDLDLVTDRRDGNINTYSTSYYIYG